MRISFPSQVMIFYQQWEKEADLWDWRSIGETQFGGSINESPANKNIAILHAHKLDQQRETF